MHFIKPSVTAVSLASILFTLTGTSTEAAAETCLFCDDAGGDDFPWDPTDPPDDDRGDEPGDGIDDDDDPPIYLPKFIYGGASDVLWHNSASGEISSWRQSSSNSVTQTLLAWTMPSSSGWKIVGTGNFDRSKDSKRDFLWYHPASGALSVWKMSGKNEPKGYEDLAWNVPGTHGWQVVGVADYNGDQHSDIYWHHPASGVISIWLMKDAQPQSTVELAYEESSAWGGRIATVGDFDNDGHPDLVIHYGDPGYVLLVHMNGRDVKSKVYTSWNASSSTGWVLEGKGDFNHDGKLDLLWHHAGTGVVGAWLMNGATVTGALNLPWNVLGSSGWKIVSR